ncbi:MAG: DNA-3-methyladenine glycosylase I [Alphaproteobacteria bacterium]|nr:3-methyladenine DNA glycosylase [Hyphomonas sp.]MBR9806017.1 DNA-3-methyladenine glycosylase I [Alphaproteobacteria bacterium]|tara:strand:- start:769 stop:1440 length:672 start_codon:yes stop_codon:yes gene_type:complete
MNTMDRIIDFAASHHGSRDAVLEMSRNSYAVKDLAKVPDDRYLATMTRCVFNAGFNWKVIETKWPGFEAAFEGFDPHKLAFFGDEMLGQLVSDARIVRNGQKIKATLENARFVAETATEHGSFGKFLKAWPQDDQAGLLDHLGKKGSRLGGATGQYFLRFSGHDTWIASGDVCRALVREDVLETPEAKSKSAMKKVQAAFTHWHSESALPYAQISRLLALSVG